jgi:predicted acylesterase/phospholipase RssA
MHSVATPPGFPDKPPPSPVPPKSPLDDMPSIRGHFPQDPVALQKLRDDTDSLRTIANAILDERAGDAPDLFFFAKGWLMKRTVFGPAAKILELAVARVDRADAPFWNKLRQQRAVATYKNEEAPPRRRLEQALKLLDEIDELAPSKDVNDDRLHEDAAETWALRGAVHRRLWDLDSTPGELHAALKCYRLSHAHDWARVPAQRGGYGALNAAFLLDALATHVRSIGNAVILRQAEDEARKESEVMRTWIIEHIGARLKIPGQGEQEWLCETMAGACLGVGLARLNRELGGAPAVEGAGSADLLEQARHWAERSVQKGEWERETTYAQWLRVAYLNEPADGAPDRFEAYWRGAAGIVNAFRRLCSSTDLGWRALAGAARRGKVGLALSGGGFRASFYHLGVLARLAEVDALRHVDVLSTVSGGSIVGAHYYLLLRKLLQQNADPGRDAYIELVQCLITQFCAGVEGNLRMRGLSNPWAALKLLLLPNYTRSDRMAQLYERRLFALTLDRGERADFAMDSMRITPKGETSFNPRFSNWRRAARVPVLLINATCLNTGHSWHFTANWMGEPPELIGEQVDKNERLRRMPYSKARGYESLGLGFAVAASACVPGIFEPLRLPDLYERRLVRLVDGGVHDNQGVDALVGQGCDIILCSDGSGQLADEAVPSNGPVGTPSRSLDILMKRLREGEHADLGHRMRMAPQRGLFFVHLKSELPADDVDWLQSDDPTPAQERKPASHGIDHEIQRHLAEIRTDLDVFSEVEAAALMVSGYAMATHQLEQLDAGRALRPGRMPWGGFELDQPAGSLKRWPFLRLADVMKKAHDAKSVARDDLVRQLKAGHDLFFRQARLSRVLQIGKWVATLGGLVALGWALWRGLGDTRLSALGLVGAGAVAAVAAVLFPRLRVWCFESFFVLFGLIASNAYFMLGLNWWCRERGRVERLLKLRA